MFYEAFSEGQQHEKWWAGATRAASMFKIPRE
jgi:hypothetical protein